MSKRNDKNAISMDPQKTARILTAGDLGRSGMGRWIIQDTRNSAPITWLDGVAHPSLIAESDGYVRPESHHSVFKRDYDRAPTHRVEIWHNPPSGEFHVRIFDEIKSATDTSKEER
jgi:hypothetical protein